MRAKPISALTVCLLVVSALPFAYGKKSKKDYAARLKTLQTIYVDGSSVAVLYIRKNLSLETCLINANEKSEAEAILEVWEESPVGCGDGGRGLCSHISARLLDPKTKELLWYLEDQHLPMTDPIRGMNGPYQWVLSNLNSSCCKGR